MEKINKLHQTMFFNGRINSDGYHYFTFAGVSLYFHGRNLVGWTTATTTAMLKGSRIFGDDDVEIMDFAELENRAMLAIAEHTKDKISDMVDEALGVK